MKTFNLVTRSFLVLFGLVLGVNLLSAAVFDGKHFLVDRFWRPVVDPRAGLPLYEDKARAKLLFGELFAMGFTYVPFVGWSRDEFAGRTVTVNSHGDREHPLTTDTPRGTIRFFGGSALWGTGADDAGTIPALFNSLVPDYRVFNHGDSGFTSRQGLARLINLANQGEPMDLVVFYDGFNDVTALCRKDISINGHIRERQIRETMKRFHLERIFFTSTFELALKVRRRLFAAPPAVEAWKQSLRCHQDPGYAEKVADTLFENWRLARTIVESRGGQFLAVLQPVVHVGNPRIDHLSDELLRLDLEDDVKRVYRILKRRLRDERVSWVADLTDVFDRDERVYIDFAHVTEHGNRLVAARIKSEVDSR